MGESRRVALLARPGEACERLRAALRDAGGDIVLEADPTAIEPQALRAAAVQTVLVALEPAVEDALERFDDVLADREVEVIFDEADLAARREGWDAARWVRHLSAKLHRHDDVLPPGREPDVLPVPGRPESPEERHAEADIAAFVAEADDIAADVPREPDLVEVALVEAELAEVAPAEADITLDAMDLAGLELGELDVGDVDLAAFEMALPNVEAMAFEAPVVEATAVEAIADEPVAEFAMAELAMAESEVSFVEAASADSEPSLSLGGLSFTDDINALDFDGGDAPAADLPAPVFNAAAHHDTHDFDALLREIGTGAANDIAEGLGVPDDLAPMDMPPVRAFAPTEDLPSLDFDIASPDAPTAKGTDLAMPDFGSLSLDAMDDQPAGVTLKSTDAPVAPKFKHDLSELERRIASLELVGEPGDAPAAESTTVTSAAVAIAPASMQVAPIEMAAIEMAPIEVAPIEVAAPVMNPDHGAVLILAGIGGPDAVRQILTALPKSFPRAVLISQRLDGGRYDRLVQQMARAASLPVTLADAAVQVAPGHVYIVPPELGIEAGEGLRFASGASLIDALPSADSAVLLLSGADPAQVDGALRHGTRGALVAGQSPDGCYDAAAPVALTARGGTAGTPHELVQSLLQRWPA